MAEPRYPQEYEFQPPPLDDIDGIVSTENDPRLISDAQLFQTNTIDPLGMAHRALHIGMIAVPVFAGLDKFANIFALWPTYLAPLFPQAIGTSPQEFMYGVGFVELVMGVGMAFKPRFFGAAFAAWLVAIMINLLILGRHLDLILYDVGILVGSYALVKISFARDAGFYGPSFRDELRRAR